MRKLHYYATTVFLLSLITNDRSTYNFTAEQKLLYNFLRGRLLVWSVNFIKMNWTQWFLTNNFIRLLTNHMILGKSVRVYCYISYTRPYFSQETWNTRLFIAVLISVAHFKNETVCTSTHSLYIWQWWKSKNEIQNSHVQWAVSCLSYVPTGTRHARFIAELTPPS